MSKYIRMQMLFRPDQREALQEYARQQGVSVTEATRQALDAGLEEITRESEWTRREEALKKMAELRAEILAQNDGKPLDIGVVEDLRQKREAQLDTISGGS